MNEDEIERGLRGVLLAEPPLGVDPDRMVDTAVRKRRRRRAGMAAGFGIAVVAAIAASAVVVTAGGEPQPASPPKPTKQQEIAQEMARNAAHLRYVLPKLLPGAAKIRVDYQATQPPDNRGSVYMTVDITFTDSAGFAEVTMQIGSPKTVAEITLSDKFCEPSRHARTTAGKPLRCDTTTLRDHSVLHVFEAGQAAGAGPGKPIDVNELDMSHQRPGIGQVIVVNHRFYVGGQLRGRYPLTEEQGVALATDPVLVMHDTGE
jgi:hypothetical protein